MPTPNTNLMITKRSAVVAGSIAAGLIALALLDGSAEPGARSATAVAIWWVVLVLAIKSAPEGLALPRNCLLSLLGLVGLTALSAASTLWAGDRGLAYEDTVLSASYAGIFALVAIVGRDRSPTAHLLGVGIGAVAVCGLALASRTLPTIFTGEATIVSDHPGFANLLLWPVTYWNGLGALAAIAIIAMSQLGAERIGLGWNAAAIGAIPIALVSLILTHSRGAVLATLIGIAVLAALSRNRGRLLGGFAIGLLFSFPAVAAALIDSSQLLGERGGERRQLLALAVLGLACRGAARLRIRLDPALERIELTTKAKRLIAGFAVVALLAIAASHDPRSAADGLTAPQPSGSASGETAAAFLDTNGNGRSQLWDSALGAFKSSPLRGIGAGGFEYWWNQDASTNAPAAHTHSLWFETAAELGLLGLGALALFLLPAASALRGRLSPDRGGGIAAAVAILAAGLATASIEWIWELPAVFSPILIAAVVITGSSRDNRPSGPNGTLATRLCLAATALAVISISVPLYLGERALNHAEAASENGDLITARAEARDATTLEPLSDRPWIELAGYERLAGEYDAALVALESAIDRAPQDPVPHLLEAELLGLRNQPGDRALYTEQLGAAMNLLPGGGGIDPDPATAR